MSVAPLQFLLLVFAGWVNRRQVETLEYLQEENRVLREQFRDRRLRFTDAQRRRVAVKGRVLGRRVLQQLAGLVTPDTILRRYRELIAKKYDGTAQRNAAQDLVAQQCAYDDWVTTFNHVRPHEALQQRTPAEVYRVSTRLPTPAPSVAVPIDSHHGPISMQTVGKPM